MGLLYPRLLAGQAKSMHESYRHMKLPELTGRVATSHESAVYIATGGDRVSETRLKELRESVVELARSAGFPHESNRQLRAEFDLDLAVALHSGMTLVPAEAASGDMWAFVALVLLPDIAYWRYPRPPGDRVLGTDLTRHVFGRMWWRAQLVHTPDDSDPYAALKVLGEAAFDQIYARRRALGGSPHLVKAILRVWNELELRGINERDALRDLLKRLLRLAPFVLFDALEDKALDEEIRVVARESLTALLGASITNTSELKRKINTVFEGTSTMTGRTEDVADAGSSSASGSEDGFSRAEARHKTNLELPPYVPYEGGPLGDPRSQGLLERTEAIATVVAAEGPVKALRVYRIICTLAGMGLEESADLLANATRYAVRTKRLTAENQLGEDGRLGATLRLPDQPECVPRERGPRDHDEIPERELASVVELIRDGHPGADLDELADLTSSALGFERATVRFKEILIAAIQRYSEP